MDALFPSKVQVKDLHDYPVNTNHAYCFTPELFKNGLLGLHPIERTFTRENKQFWREVVKANVKHIRAYQKNIAFTWEHVEEGKPSPHQEEYLDHLNHEIEQCTQALRIAAYNRLTTQGMQAQRDSHALALLEYLRKLREWECEPTDNLYRRNVVEDALCEFHKFYWYHNEVKGHQGKYNEKYLKELVAIINTMTDYRDIFNMAISFSRMADRLTALNAGAPQQAPTFSMERDFYIHDKKRA